MIRKEQVLYLFWHTQTFWCVSTGSIPAQQYPGCEYRKQIRKELKVLQQLGLISSHVASIPDLLPLMQLSIIILSEKLAIYLFPCSRTKHQIKTWVSKHRDFQRPHVWSGVTIFVILVYDPFHCIRHTNRFFCLFCFVFLFYFLLLPQDLQQVQCVVQLCLSSGSLPCRLRSLCSTENSWHCSGSLLTKHCSLMASASVNLCLGWTLHCNCSSALFFISKHDSSYDVGCKQTVFWSL